MKKWVMLLWLLMAGAGVFAQQYTPVDAGSSIKFIIKNFGLNVDGSFKGIQGKISFNPENTGTADFNVSVEAASVNTGNGTRDNHLRKEEYFDVAKYPRIGFVSSKVTATGKPGEYLLEGILTVKGISKPISFPFVASSNGNLFTGQFKINRRDFKVGGSSWVLSDDVTVTLNVSVVKQ
jgi:polyisoprenoid-binding protein YceI